MEHHWLIVGLNWLGDAIMATPALQSWRHAHGDARITILSKPALATYWPLALPDASVVRLAPGWRGMRSAIATLRALRPDACRILPNSFRAALLPCLAGIPERYGLSVQGRGLLLNHRLRFSPALEPRHQALEIYALLGLPPPSSPPALCLPSPDLSPMLPRFGLGTVTPATTLAILPGAARGPAKRWPVDRFAAVARQAAERGWTVWVLGTASEAAWCAPVATAAGARGVNLAGRTSLPELAALLGHCRAAVCNDSGGMHLAAAMGAKVVAIFGLTDPHKTGPLGKGHHLLQAPGIAGRRRIARHSPAAERALAAISVPMVWAALEQAMFPA